MAGLLLSLMSAMPSAANGAAPLLREFCPPGSEAAQCRIPRGIAVDPNSGNAYVADQANDRIKVFTPWGEFLRTWGWDVVASGPGDDTNPPEDEFEICVPANGDVCKDGLRGDGAGEFAILQGVALNPAGDVYVVDWENRRVQKFDPEGNFIVMFGGDVNKTKVEALAPEAQRNRCPVDPGDVCQAGLQGTGNGQFGAWAVGSFIAASPAGTIYVGDRERIQEFDAAGNYLGNLPDPQEVLKEETVQSLAADPAGSLYLALEGEENVLKLSATGTNACPGGGVLKVKAPRAVAATADNAYVVDGAKGAGVQMIIRRFTADCTETIDAEFPFSEGFDSSTGIATSQACGLGEQEPPVTDLFVSNSNEANSFIRLYGPPPDPTICPPPEEPPDVVSQYATSVGSGGATVRADINPRFWDDTRYYVQYGTGKCSEGGCEATQPLPPGSLLTSDVVNAPVTSAGVFLGSLEPGTTYHYRFVAQSSGGGPVFGVDPDGPGPEEASTEDGLEATFTTFPLTLKPKVDCPNQAFRIGLSAPLPDCRAYEMVSPVDKENGDVATDETFNNIDYANIQLAAPNGERVTYSSFRSFADPEGAPLMSQYLAQRDAKAGWGTHSISPPRTSVPFYPALSHANTTQFKAFSEDLCSGWFIQDTDLALLPGAPPGVPNIYRRDDGLCGAPGYGLITSVAPAGYPVPEELEANSTYGPEVQGITPDSSQTLLRADAVLSADACQVTIEDEEGVVVDEGKGLYQVYLHSEPAGELDLVSALPSGAPACVHASGGTAQGQFGATRASSVHHALSEDASRVFWSTSAAPDRQLPPYSGGADDQPGPLYVRLNPTQPASAQALGAATGSGKLTAGTKVVTTLKTTTGAFAVGQSITGPGIAPGTTVAAVTATTLTLSANATASATNVALEAFSECTEPEKACTVQISSANDTRFWTADPDGSAALYTAGGGLFEYDVAAETSTPIAATGVKGVMGASTDLSHVYFASTAVLTGATQNGEGRSAVAGQPNLYLSERGVGTTFVGTLSEDDAGNLALNFEAPSPIATLPDRRTSRISADGLHAAFTSSAPLTGYDNTDVASGEADAEVFLYDASPGDPGELSCISCNPSGARPRGADIHIGGFWVAAQIPGWEYQLYPSRPLSEDSNRIFFESFEALVLRDTNGKRDVYEWERAVDEEACEEAGAEIYVASSGGCLSLISSGKSEVNSEFLDASASGSDAFFITAGDLLPQDFGLLDVYDAREGGGFPPPPSPKPPCEGEACQPAPPPPEDPTPASSAFEGEGNVTPAPTRRACPKGKRRVVRGGRARCVKKHRKGKGKRAARRAARSGGRGSR